ncbi:PQQ-like beta-propeller repeat protein [bacterium]|nr:PQQ-like beta-propeller repeat protein [bacterium]
MIRICWAMLFLLTGCQQKVNGPDEKQNERILWTFAVESEIYYSSPALSLNEETVYFGTSSGILAKQAANNALYAVAVATGQVLWKFPLGIKEVRSSPAVCADGSIAFVASERNSAAGPTVRDLLYRLSSNGQLQWTFNINPGLQATVDVGQSAPSVASDGVIYAAAGGLYAINPDGTCKWTQFQPAAEDIRNAPVIGKNGVLYFVYHNIPLTALDPTDGHTLWSCDLGVNDHVLASPAIGADGRIIVATNPGIVYAVAPTGEILWSFDTASIGYTCTLRSSPAIDEDGTIYLGTNTGNPASIFLALNPNGTVKWIFEPANLPGEVSSSHFDIYSSPAIGADGIIYFGQEFGRVYGLYPQNGEIQWMVETKSGITWSSPALSSAGTLFISDLSGRLYAIKTASQGLKAQAPWPKFKHDNQNSGAAGQ